MATTERELLSIALQLGAEQVAGWSAAEKSLAKTAQPVSKAIVAAVREQIRAGADPLGDWFGELRSPEQRRDLGATYTPLPIVNAMLNWAAEQETPARIVDPGVGSARFLRHAARIFPNASLIGVEVDPLAAIIARANLAVVDVAKRSRILLQDYRDASLKSAQRTLWLEPISKSIGLNKYVDSHACCV